MSPWSLVLEIVRIVRIWLEIKLRRLLIDEKERIENESEDLEEQIEKYTKAARDTGNTTLLDRAERLRKRFAQRAQFGTLVTTHLSALESRDSSANNGRDLHADPK